MEQISTLPEDLEFVPISERTLVGEPQRIPTAITLLGEKPLALLAQFRVDPEGTETDPVKDLLEGVPPERAALTFDEGLVSLSLYDLTGLDNAAIRLFLDRTAETLMSTDYAVPEGCLHCGEVERAELLYAEGRPTRLCPTCLESAVQQQRQQETELNSPSLKTAFSLPGAVAYGILVWALFWTMIDLTIEAGGIQVIEINRLTILVGLVLLGSVGYGLGWPIGATIRKAAAFRRAPRLCAAVITVGVAIMGEIAMVAVFVLRKVGVFDLVLAAQIVGQFVETYTGFWICCKSILAVAMGIFCATSASQKLKVGLQV